VNEREIRFCGYAAVGLWGLLRGRSDWVSSAAMTIGVSGLAAEGYAYARDRDLFKHPEHMNAYFKTDGALSATRGPADVAALRKANR